MQGCLCAGTCASACLSTAEKSRSPAASLCAHSPHFKLRAGAVQEGNRLGRSAVFLLSVILRHLIGIRREEGADREPWDQGWGRGEGRERKGKGVSEGRR